MSPVPHMSVRSPGTIPGAADAVPITGFDPVRRAWTMAPHTGLRRVPLPALEGRLMVDAAVQASAGNADGAPVAAMLLPGTVADIVRMLRFCGEHDIAMTAPGAHAAGATPVVRVHAAALGRHRPVLRVVGAD